MGIYARENGYNAENPKNFSKIDEELDTRTNLITTQQAYKTTLKELDTNSASDDHPPDAGANFGS